MSSTWGYHVSGKMFSVKSKHPPIWITTPTCLSLLAPKGTPALEKRPKRVPFSCDSRWAHCPRRGRQVKCFGSGFQPAWVPLGKAKGPGTSVSKYVRESSGLLCNRHPTCWWKMLWEWPYFFLLLLCHQWLPKPSCAWRGCLEAAILSPCLKGVDSM